LWTNDGSLSTNGQRETLLAALLAIYGIPVIFSELTRLALHFFPPMKKLDRSGKLFAMCYGEHGLEATKLPSEENVTLALNLLRSYVEKLVPPADKHDRLLRPCIKLLSTRRRVSLQ
jgi:hypothetical protein